MSTKKNITWLLIPIITLIATFSHTPELTEADALVDDTQKLIDEKNAAGESYESLTPSPKSSDIWPAWKPIGEFSDVKEGNTHYVAIEYLRANGIIEGYTMNGENKFKPKQKISRAEALKIFMLASKTITDVISDVVDKGYTLRQTNESPLSDVPVNSWFAPYVSIAKEKGILSCIEEMSFFLNKNNIKVILFKKDGDTLNAGRKIAELYGNARKILSLERTCLNVLQRMSGISTETKLLAGKLRNNVKIAGTRKTILGPLEHKAISVGGGLSHRLGLYDSILIKDNHLGFLDKDLSKGMFISLLNAAIRKKKSRFIEIEAPYPSRAILAAEYIGAIRKKWRIKIPFIIMLDNFSPWIIWKTLKRIDKECLENILIEASGRINGKNIKKYCIKGVDVISMGCLTNSAKALDISMDIIK